MRVFRRADLEAGIVEPIAQFDFGKAIPEGFVFTRDGRYLYGSSYFTGVSNIFRYELATGELEAVSNAETGFFRPIPMADGTLIVQEYTGTASRRRSSSRSRWRMSAQSPSSARKSRRSTRLCGSGSSAPPADVDLEPMITRRGKYRPMRELGYGDGYPIVEGYRDSAALGWHAALRRPRSVPQARYFRQLLLGSRPARG